MDLSIIIVSYNTKSLLDRCLFSICQNVNGVSFEIIVIDNNSQDNSIAMLKEKYPQVILVENQQNLGFAKACNQGIGRSSGEYLFFLNPDTLVNQKIFEHIVDFFESNPQVGIGGCYVYYPDGRPQTSFYKFTTLSNALGTTLSLFRFLPRNRLTESLFRDYPKDNVPSEVDRVLGGAMVVRGSLLNVVGLFDESYFLYSEEEDFCYRTRKSGWRVAPMPDTKVLHYHGQSSLGDLKNATFHSFYSSFIYFRKFHPAYEVILFRVVQFWGAFFRVVFWSALYLFCSKGRNISQGKLAGYVKLLLSDFKYSKSLVR